MISEKKIEFLINQGFDKDVINMFINCGVEKNLIWFLAVCKKESIKNFNSEEIRLINDYLNRGNLLKIKKTTYAETLRYALAFQKNEKRKNKNKLYEFENGFYISLLNPIDLKEEGELMSNCVGAYDYRVEKGSVAILALKQSSGKTVAHIEIKKNGLIGQNYAKANSKINNYYWMMILEFFKNNHKEVDLSKLFGESYVATHFGDHINDIILTVPTSIRMFIDNGIKKSETINGFEIKRFASFPNQTESAKKFNSQKDVLDWIEEKKENLIKTYDELKNQILETTASRMFLSDKMKEKIFGSKKDSYYMKGDDYNLEEINPTYGELIDTTMEEAGAMDDVTMPVQAPNEAEADAPNEAPAIRGIVYDGEDIREDAGGGIGNGQNHELVRERRPVVILERLRNALVNVDNERVEENFEPVQGIYVNGENGELLLEEVEHLGEYGVEVGNDFPVEQAEYPIEMQQAMPPEPLDQIFRRAT